MKVKEMTFLHFFNLQSFIEEESKTKSINIINIQKKFTGVYTFNYILFYTESELIGSTVE